MKQLNSDLIGGLIVTGLAVFFHLLRDEFTRLAAMFPDAVIPVVGALGIAILVKAFVKPQYISSEVFRTNHIMVLTVLLGFAWVLSMKRIGFAVSGFFAITFLLLVFSGKFTLRNALRCSALAAMEIGLVYLVFGWLLNVSFPSGILF